MAEELAKNKANWGFYLVVAAVSLIAVALILSLGLSGSAAGPYHIKVTDRGGVTNSYTALPEAGEVFGSNLYVERWKWVIRGDDTCNGSIFTNDGEGQGNLSDVVYYSNVFDPTEQQIVEYDGQYICFSALLSDGSWENGLGTQLDLIPEVSTDNDPLPGSWDSYCLNESSYWEGSSPEEAWCDENDERTPIKGGRAAGVAFAPISSAELTGFIEGYISGETADNEKLVWRDLYQTFESFVADSGIAATVCYQISGDRVDFYKSVSGGDIPADVPADLQGFVSGYASLAVDEERNNFWFLAEASAYILLIHQVVQSGDGETLICKYDAITSDIHLQEFFFSHSDEFDL